MNKISYYKKRITEEIRIHRVRKSLNLSDVTVISQNCIGGVLYHDCNAKFLSPTVNLYFLPSDFIKFVLNLDFYLNETPTVSDEGKFPVGTFSDGLKIYFMHYKDKEEALEKWESRKREL